jgi:glycosyltransferase involved in cell wall biosynthesis
MDINKNHVFFNRIKLTIGIPTFNRNEILKSNIIKLLPQLNSECELLILDNNSQVPVEESLRDVFNQFNDVNKRIIRHRSNVGGNENILRCIEHAQGDFVWILGDDDQPFDEAVANIFNEIHDHPDAYVINMYAPCSAHSLRRNTLIVEGGAGYLGAKKFLGELMFISSMVLRVDSALKNMQSAHLWQSSHAPHLIVAVMMLRPNAKAVISCREVVYNGGMTTPLDSQASAIPIALGFPSLMHPLWNEDESRLIIRHLQNIRRSWITPMGVVNGLVSLANQGGVESKCLAVRYYYLLRRNFFALGNILSIDNILFICAWPLVVWPKLGSFVRKIAWRIFKGSEYDAKTERSLHR